MVWRTPSSLKWLIGKRARLSGRLSRVQNERSELLDRLKVLDKRSKVLRKQLSALDQTFGLHEIEVDPEGIRPIKHHIRNRLLPHGQLSRVLLGELRIVGGWASTTEVVNRVWTHLPHMDVADAEPVRDAIRMRLNALVRKGVLESDVGVSFKGYHDGKTETRWRIAGRSAGN